MATVNQGTWQTTTVVYNPMVPLNPGTVDAVYSTMSYVRQRATKAGMCCATLTFDQPLYLKAYKIKCDNPQEFSQLFLRLGGFHLLMSFLGAGCKLMEGSGLDELWATVYANNSIPQMMEEKAYSRTLRACLLTDAALHLVLLQCNSTDEDSKAMDNTVLIPDELEENSLSDDEISETTSVLSVEMSSIQWDKDQQTMASDSPIDMECQSSQVLESSGPMVDSLRLDYQALLDGKVSEEDTENWDTLLILHREVCKMKDVEEGSRTRKLWLTDTVSIHWIVTCLTFDIYTGPIPMWVVGFWRMVLAGQHARWVTWFYACISIYVTWIVIHIDLAPVLLTHNSF